MNKIHKYVNKALMAEIVIYVFYVYIYAQFVILETSHNLSDTKYNAKFISLVPVMLIVCLWTLADRFLTKRLNKSDGALGIQTYERIKLALKGAVCIALFAPIVCYIISGSFRTSANELLTEVYNYVFNIGIF